MTRAFTTSELKRVGTAATMLVVCGTVIIIAMTMMLGHYNSLAHSGPKAVLDGAVIALLLGRQGRWRCLALLGAVYGLVLLLQVGVFYLLPVMMLAAAMAAIVGRGVDFLNRTAALVTAAMVYELFAGFGAPIKIYFGTGGRSEPFLWGLWFAEWPLRIIGAAIGVWLTTHRQCHFSGTVSQPSTAIFTAPSKSGPSRTAGTAQAAIRLTACLIACTVPMAIDHVLSLGLLAFAYAVFGRWTGLRYGLLHALAGLCWGWVVFGSLSFAWNHDLSRVLDMSRTLVLRFTPMTIAAMVVVQTVRPVDVIRLLRKLRVSAAVLLPLSTVLRSIPHSRRMMRQSIESLRRQGQWKSPLSLLRHPLKISRALLEPQIRQWAGQLAEEAAWPLKRPGP